MSRASMQASIGDGMLAVDKEDKRSEVDSKISAPMINSISAQVHCTSMITACRKPVERTSCKLKEPIAVKDHNY